MPCLHDLEIALHREHHVESAAAVAEHAERIKVSDRRHAHAVDAVLDLRRRLRKMREHRRFQILRHGGEILEQRFACRILGMESDPAGYQRIVRVEHFVIAPCRFRRSAVIVRRAADHEAEARIARAFGDAVHVIVHIERRRDAARNVFEHGELGKVVDIVAGQVCLHREAVLVQPLLQRLVVRKRAQKRHCRMRVRILEARHQQIAAAVDLAVERGRRDAVRIADQRDAITLYPEFALEDCRFMCFERKDARVVKPNVHAGSLSLLLLSISISQHAPQVDEHSMKKAARRRLGV